MQTLRGHTALAAAFVRAATCLLLAALVIAGPAALARAGLSRECRQQCVAAINECLVAGLAPLGDEGLSGQNLRRRGRRIRHRCKHRTVYQCRRDGLAGGRVGRAFDAGLEAVVSVLGERPS